MLKKTLLVVAALSLSSVTLNSLAQGNPSSSQPPPPQNLRTSVGIGAGIMYSGLGANFALVSEHDLKYVSAGCRYDDECGFGIGWIKTDLIDTGSNKHGLGLYFAKVDEEVSRSRSVWQYEDRVVYHTERKDVYGIGVSYTYFWNGINQPGVTLGTSAHIKNSDDDNRLGVGLQLGYQF